MAYQNKDGTPSFDRDLESDLQDVGPITVKLTKEEMEQTAMTPGKIVEEQRIDARYDGALDVLALRLRNMSDRELVNFAEGYKQVLIIKELAERLEVHIVS